MKYKKSILTAGSIAAVGAPLAAVVSCGFDFGRNYQRKGGDVVLVTDTGSVADKSFNQAAWDGVKAFGNGAGNTSFSYIIPSKLTPQIFHKAYRTAFDAGAKTLVLPGFHHAFFADGGVGKSFGTKDDPKTPFTDETAPGVNGFEGSYPTDWNHNFIGIDIPDADKTNHVFSENFKTSQSGFLAAVYTGVYMNANNKIKGNELRFAGYGGMNIPSVTPFLNGYLQGAAYFNGELAKSNPDSWKKMKPVFAEGTAPSSKDFTNSFNPGDATTLSNTYLLEKKAQIIVSVAGPQTADSIGAIKEAGLAGEAYVIGPDTDQSLAYDPNIVLGSMMKGITASTKGALEAIKRKDMSSKFLQDATFIYNDNPNVQNLKAEDMLVGFQPSQASIQNGTDKNVSRSSGIYKNAIDFVKKDKLGADAIIYDNSNKGGKSSIDVVKEKFLDGHIDRVADLTARDNLHLNNNDIVIVDDARTAKEISEQDAKFVQAINELDESIDAMIAKGITTVTINGKNVTVQKTGLEYDKAKKAIENSIKEKITRIFIWKSSENKFDTKIDTVFAGGMYGQWNK